MSSCSTLQIHDECPNTTLSLWMFYLYLEGPISSYDHNSLSMTAWVGTPFIPSDCCHRASPNSNPSPQPPNPPRASLASETSFSQIRSNKQINILGEQPSTSDRWALVDEYPSCRHFSGGILQRRHLFGLSSLSCLASLSCISNSFTCISFILGYHLHLDLFFRTFSRGNLNTRTLVLNSRGNTGGDIAIHSVVEAP